MHVSGNLVYFPEIQAGRRFARILALMGNPVRATILVVDDDPGVRDALHLILDDDYDVIDAADAAQALAALASRKIDLILLDLVLVGGDGFELLECRKEEHKTVPVIVLSGLNNAWVATTAARLGAADYVTKPFEEDDLLEVVRETLRTHAMTQAEARPSSRRATSVFLVGLGLGVYASLAVLLREHCPLALAQTVVDALSSSTVSVSLLIVDLGSLGLPASMALPRLRGRFPEAELLAVAPGAASASGLEAPARVTDFLAAIRRHRAKGEAETRVYSPRVASVLDHLGTSFADASVRRIARAVGGAPDYLSACFREETGLPLKAYMTELRIEAAKWLLLEAGEKLETVAARVGLHDASHLSRLFMRYAGARPGAYRKRSRLPS